MPDTVDPEELVERVASLEEQLNELQDELGRSELVQAAHTSTSRDVFRAADKHAIPALIAVLEAQIHVLRLLQRTIRLMTPPPSNATADRVRSRAFREATRSLISQLDSLVGDLDAVTVDSDGGSLEALMEEAQAIRADLADLTQHRAVSSTDHDEHDGANGSQSTEDDATDDGTRIDIDAELRSIKSEFSTDAVSDEPEDDRADERSDRD